MSLDQQMTIHKLRAMSHEELALYTMARLARLQKVQDRLDATIQDRNALRDKLTEIRLRVALRLDAKKVSA